MYPIARKVTRAWGEIHKRHPTVYKIHYPQHISRLKRRDFARVIQKTCSLPKDSLILEAGAGSGRDSLYFSTIGHKCVALDYYLTPLLSLKDTKTSHTSNLSLAITSGDIFSLPFPVNTFDMVFNSGVIEHYDQESRTALLEELTRVAKTNGFVCVIFPNKYHILDPLWGDLISRFSDHDEYDIPEQFKSTEQITKEMNSVGLHSATVEWIDVYDTISHYPYWVPLRLLSYLANVLLPWPPRFMRKKLATRILAIGSKRPANSDVAHRRS
ncbi:MAG: class I SAM-dependent methyltransferase [Bacteroidota bacterium]